VARYARVSTNQQELALQRDTLAAAGCAGIFSDTASGALDERPELALVLDHLRESDTLVAWRLDRLGRSLRHLVDTVSGLAERDARLAKSHPLERFNDEVERRTASSASGSAGNAGVDQITQTA
jgi:DNA invertase Pin-like site-specific DNA recombinase